MVWLSKSLLSSTGSVSAKYDSEFYPFEVRESGGGWQFLTKKDYHKTVAQLNGEKFLKRLSSAAMETLAIIAYKQPITKGEIESIRGVSSDYSIQKLLEKELIIISGRNENMPGKPLVYCHFPVLHGLFRHQYALPTFPNSKKSLPRPWSNPPSSLANRRRPAGRTTAYEETGGPILIVSEDGEARSSMPNTNPKTDPQAAMNGQQMPPAMHRAR